MPKHKDGWGIDVTFRVHLSNGETLYKVITTAELREATEDNLFAARNALKDLVHLFENWHDVSHISMVRDGRNYYLNPAHIMYVSTTGFDSWATE